MSSVNGDISGDGFISVSEGLSYLFTRASETYATAVEHIDALGQAPEGYDGNPPSLQLGALDWSFEAPGFGEQVPPEVSDTFVADALEAAKADAEGVVKDVELEPITQAFPTYTKPNVAINLPSQPPPLVTGDQPSKPGVDWSVSMPVKPDLDTPVMDTLESITIPTFEGVTLTQFDGSAPTLDVPANPTVFVDWSEAEYNNYIADELRPVIINMLGGRGLPESVENALFERARVKEVQTAQNLSKQAFEEWSARGFFMPPGMLVKQVNVAQQQAALAQNTLARDIMAKQWDLHYENLKFAVQQGISAESLFMQHYNNVIMRTFEMAKLRVDMQVKVYDLMVTVFNAKVMAYKTKADVWKTEIEGELAKLEVYKTQLEGEKIKGDINQTKVNVFAQQVQAMSTMINLYKTEIEAEMSRVEIAKAQMDGYKTEVQAWAEKINAEKTRFDVYSTAVNAEVAKIQLVKTAADAFAAEVSAYKAELDTKKAKADVQLSLNDAKLKELQTIAGLQKTAVDAEVSGIGAKVEIFKAAIQKYQADITLALETKKVKGEINEAKLKEATVRFEGDLKNYDALLTKFYKEVELRQKALEVAAQAASSLAQGALSAIHVSNGLSSSWNNSVGFSYSGEVSSDVEPRTVF